MRTSGKLIGWALSGLLAAAVLWFWLMPYRCFLSYQEQYQLFLFSTDYFLERVSLPGGLADYVSEFLVQLFYIPALGALSLALLTLALQRVTWALCRDYGAADWCFPLSFVPVFALWFMMSDENVLPAFPLSLTAALALSHACNRIESAFAKYALLLLGLTAGYWLIGPSVFVLAVNSLTAPTYTATVGATPCGRPDDLGVNNNADADRATAGGRPYRGGSRFYRPWIILAIVAATLLPPILSHLALPYELRRFFTGINYCRYPVYDTTVQLAVTALFAFTPVVCGLLSRRICIKKTLAFTATLTAAIAACGGALVFGSFNSAKCDLIEYDYLVRQERWDDLIEKAEKNPPKSPMGVSCVNLALSQRGLLAERLFEFYQNGGDGLFPPFVRDMTSPVPTAETFFRLGMVNDAHRYFYEAQASIPNYRLSGRFMRRLAECEIVNGQYEVARKWLRMLARSLFYRDWAKGKLSTLDDEEHVASDPTTSKLRSLQPVEDYLFSDTEMDQMLGMLFVRNNANRMAYEYLMCYVLLQKDVQKFMEYYPIGRLAGYTRIPTVFQEVLVGVCLERNPDPKAIPYKVDSSPLNNTMGFIRLYVKDRDNPSLDQRPYSTNAWNYLLRGGAIRAPDNSSRQGIY